MYNGIEGETGHMHALGGDALPRWLEVQCMMHARSRAATREASTDRSMHTRGCLLYTSDAADELD
eukprot:1256383-Ditylum_brightwellii.AAC.1